MSQMLILCDMPRGRAVYRHEDRGEGLKHLKKLWKTVDCIIDDIEVPKDLDAQGLLDFFDNAAFTAMENGIELYSREQLIEAELI